MPRSEGGWNSCEGTISPFRNCPRYHSGHSVGCRMGFANTAGTSRFLPSCRSEGIEAVVQRRVCLEVMNFVLVGSRESSVSVAESERASCSGSDPLVGNHGRITLLNRSDEESTIADMELVLSLLRLCGPIGSPQQNERIISWSQLFFQPGGLRNRTWLIEDVCMLLSPHLIFNPLPEENPACDQCCSRYSWSNRILDWQFPGVTVDQMAGCTSVS